MSDRPCNRCIYRKLVQQAESAGKLVAVQPSEDMPGSVNVLLHSEGEEPDLEQHFAAWFMALPDECAC